MDAVGEEEENNPGFLSRLISSIHLIIDVLYVLSFNVSIVTPLNNSKIYTELSKIKGGTGNVIAE